MSTTFFMLSALVDDPQTAPAIPCAFKEPHKGAVIPCVECGLPTCHDHARGVDDDRRCPRCTRRRIIRYYSTAEIGPAGLDYWLKILRDEI